jgi:hypothetical protein
MAMRGRSHTFSHMHPLTPDRRGEAVAYAERHSDPFVREAIRALQEENAVLRDVIAEEQPAAMSYGRRRFVGRIVAVLVLAVAVIAVASMASKKRSSRAFQEGFRQGINAGAVTPPPPLPALPAIPAVPATPAAPAPRALRP